MAKEDFIFAYSAQCLPVMIQTGNKEIKIEFFCFDKEFLIALVDFRRSKSLRIEDFMRSRGKQMQSDYEKYSEYF